MIQGGSALKGTVTLSGAKNVALKLIIASLLCEGRVVLTNVPRIGDVEELLHLMIDLGVGINWKDKHELEIDPTTLKNHKVDLLYGSKTRVSFMLFAPLLHRFGRALIPNPGGCRIGERPIDRHIEMLRAFGAQVEYDSSTGYYSAKANSGLKTAKFRFSKPTHTGTELAIMLASLIEGQSTIENCAREPEIDDLIAFLAMAGVKIERNDDVISVWGVSKLKNNKEPFTISFDRNEAVTYASFALATKGDIEIIGASRETLSSFIEKVREAGAGVEEKDNSIRFFYQGPLKATEIVTDVSPGFMTDWQAPWAVLMTQAEGVSTIHERIFENRFSYAPELIKLGAKFEYFSPPVENREDFYHFNWKAENASPQAVRIYGKTKLHNGVLKVTDLRAGATLLIAASVASGESVVLGASIIDRGYETIEVKLRQMGANIKRV